ncbi:MAG: glycosyltransferase family 39 protein [Anaerolineae bacterium]|nr:glycosyltransferase family 39 protein [Anaerolineae bacterium]
MVNRVGRSLLLLAALGSAAFGLQRFAWQGEDGSVQAIWLLSILLFLASQAPWQLLRRAGGATRRIWPARATLFNLLILVVILSAAFWLRVNRLEIIPYDFHGDMASYGIQGREIIMGNQWRLFQEGWANIPMIGYLPTAAAMALFGNNLFGLNMSAVIAGMLSLLAFYLFIWRLFDSPRLALLATALVAINVPHIHFAPGRTWTPGRSICSPSSCWWMAYARRNFSLALAGVLLSFGLQMYYSGRVVLFIIAGFLLFALLFRRDWIKGNLIGLTLMALGLLIGLGPSLIYFARNQDALVERSRSVFLFYPAVMNHLMGKYGVSTPWAVFLEQARLSLLMFHVSADSTRSSATGTPCSVPLSRRSSPWALATRCAAGAHPAPPWRSSSGCSTSSSAASSPATRPSGRAWSA